MKQALLDDSISKFNEFINNELNWNLIYKIYNTDSDKNLWNCICSCMDWIIIYRDYINNLEYDNCNINIKCIQIYSYISAIDVIHESIAQLNRVINKTDRTIFEGDKSIFNNELNLDDNNHFKEIRAAFGAHPVNLRDRDDKSKRYFSSWPLEYDFGEKYDFYCNLYTNDKDGEDKEIGFKFNQLDEFLIKRYSQLDILKSKIKRDIDSYLSNIIKQIPKLGKNQLENIKKLKIFLESRLQNDYYIGILNQVEKIFTAYEYYENNNFKINNYIERLNEVILEIYNNLLEKKFDELDSDYIINIKIDTNRIKYSDKYPKNMYNYYISKLYDYIYKDNYKLKNSCIDAINEYFYGHFELSYEMDKYELLLVFNSGIFYF